MHIAKILSLIWQKRKIELLKQNVFYFQFGEVLWVLCLRYISKGIFEDIIDLIKKISFEFFFLFIINNKFQNKMLIYFNLIYFLFIIFYILFYVIIFIN